MVLFSLLSLHVIPTNKFLLISNNGKTRKLPNILLIFLLTLKNWKTMLTKSYGTRSKKCLLLSKLETIDSAKFITKSLKENWEKLAKL